MGEHSLMGINHIPYEQFDPFVRDSEQADRAAWTFTQNGEDEIEIWIRCPNCCMVSHLFQHHVSVLGEVTPSIWCQCPKSLHAECKNPDWHVWGKLLHWDLLIGKPKPNSANIKEKINVR